MCLVIKQDYSENPIPVLRVKKILFKNSLTETYCTPYWDKHVPNNGVLVPDNPKFHGMAESTYYNICERTVHSAGRVDGGLIHSYLYSRPTSMILHSWTTHDINEAYALGAEYVGKTRDVASRAVYIPAADKLHTEYQKEKFCKFLRSLDRLTEISEDEQQDIINFIYNQEED